MSTSTLGVLLKDYKELTRLGIGGLVLTTVACGFLLGQSHEMALVWSDLGFVLMGLFFLASGASALNQVQEVDLDRQMARTSSRPLPAGRMAPWQAALLSALLIVSGLFLLTYLNVWLGAYGLLALFSYNVLYTLWWKRHWAFAAVPGALPGALPVLMGYVAASGEPLPPGGLYVFALLFLWQMPHFWSLAIKLSWDYQKSGVPTLPVKLGEMATVDHIRLWALGYIGVALMGPLFLKVGVVYLVPTGLTCLWLLYELRRFSNAPSPKRAWFRFFMGVNVSLVAFFLFALADQWGVWLVAPLT